MEGEQQVQLFNRFYCRMREIIYAYLNFYLNSNSYMFIREFLISVNKQVLQFRPDSDPTLILTKISDLIILETKKLAGMRNVTSKVIDEAIEEVNCREAMTEPSQDRASTISYTDSTSNRMKRMNSQKKTLIQMMGWDILSGLDRK